MTKRLTHAQLARRPFHFVVPAAWYHRKPVLCTLAQGGGSEAVRVPRGVPARRGEEHPFTRSLKGE